MNKKIILTILALAIVIPSIANAASLYFMPLSGEYTKGQNFSVSVFVNSEGGTIYTAKAEVKYPSDKLSVKSFTFNNDWMPLKQTGYDQIDNTNGVLIKTGGYPGGLSGSVSLGTIYFEVKKTGTAEIEIGTNSILIDIDNQNSLVGFSKASFNLIEKPIVKEVKVETESVKTTEPKDVVKEEKTDEQLENIEKETLSENIAAVSGADTRSTTGWILIVVLTTLLGCVAGFLVGRKINFPKS